MPWLKLQEQVWKLCTFGDIPFLLRSVSRRNSRRRLVGGATCWKTLISWSALDKNPTPPRLLFLHTLYIPTLIPSPFPNFQNPLIVSSRHIIISKTSYFLNIVFAHTLPISCLNGSLFARSSVLAPGLTIYHWAELKASAGLHFFLEIWTGKSVSQSFFTSF